MKCARLEDASPERAHFIRLLELELKLPGLQWLIRK